MKKLNFALIALAAASTAAAFDPNSPSCSDLSSGTVASRIPSLRDSVAWRIANSGKGAAMTPELRKALQRITPVEPGVRRAPAVPAGLLRPRHDASAAPPLAAAAGPQAVGDVFVHNQFDFFGTGTRRLANPNGASDYYALRSTTSQVAKQLPFQVDAAWMFMDDTLAWSKNWQVRVVTENPANPFLPDLNAVVSGPVTFDASAPPYNFAFNAGGPTVTENVKVELPNQDYPLTGRFAINDGAMNDNFDRANEDLAANANWVECLPAPAGCFVGTTLKINANQLRPSAPGTALGWRGADPNAGDCNSGTAVAPCVRYVMDYVDDHFFSIYHPDQDAQYSIDFNLTAANASAVGIFTRGALDFASNPPAMGTFYAAWVDKAAGSLKITTENPANVLASTPLAVTSGTLVVEVSGFNPVTIRASVGATSTTATDATVLYQGDVGYGNIGGVIFPNAGGGEVADNLVTRRNADLFTVLKMPTGEGAVLWADNRGESRDFYNTFISSDGTAWGQTGLAADVDCSKTRNTIVALQTRDGSGGSSIFQTNDTVMSLFIPCCTCPEKAYTCGLLPYLDECGPVSSWTPDFVPEYQVGQPISIDPKFLNDHAPDRVGRVLYYWIVCNDLDPNCSFVTCDPGPGPTQNCGAYAFGLGALLANNEIPGLNTTTSSDIPNWDPDSFLDGTLFLQAATPSTFTPQVSGNYHVQMFELFDYTTPPDGPDDPNPDEYAANWFTARHFTVGGCVQALPWNVNKNSFWLAKNPTCTTAGDLYAEWRPQTLPLDPTTPFNIHEITTRANLISTLTPCAPTCNPWPDAPKTTGIVNTTTCITPVDVNFDVNYYALYQADECTLADRADQ